MAIPKVYMEPCHAGSSLLKNSWKWLQANISVPTLQEENHIFQSETLPRIVSVTVRAVNKCVQLRWQTIRTGPTIHQVSGTSWASPTAGRCEGLHKPSGSSLSSLCLISLTSDTWVWCHRLDVLWAPVQ